MNERTRRYSLCMNIDGFVCNNRYPRDYEGVFEENGKTLSASQVRTFLALEKAKGHVVIPCSSECGNPCQHADNGCTGFDYSGRGCPGRFIEEQPS